MKKEQLESYPKCGGGGGGGGGNGGVDYLVLYMSVLSSMCGQPQSVAQNGRSF